MGENNETFSKTNAEVVNLALNVFSACTAIVLNTLTIHALRRTSSLPKPMKTLLLSIALSDLAVGLVSQPLFIVSISRPSFMFMIIPLWPIVTTLANASFFGVIALSVDRFLAVHFHLRYQELVTQKRVIIAIVLLGF